MPCKQHLQEHHHYSRTKKNYCCPISCCIVRTFNQTSTIQIQIKVSNGISRSKSKVSCYSSWIKNLPRNDDRRIARKLFRYNRYDLPSVNSCKNADVCINCICGITINFNCIKTFKKCFTSIRDNE